MIVMAGGSITAAEAPMPYAAIIDVARGRRLIGIKAGTHWIRTDVARASRYQVVPPAMIRQKFVATKTGAGSSSYGSRTVSPGDDCTRWNGARVQVGTRFLQSYRSPRLALDDIGISGGQRERSESSAAALPFSDGCKVSPWLPKNSIRMRGSHESTTTDRANQR